MPRAAALKDGAFLADVTGRDLSTARVVVSGGRGLASKENMERLGGFAELAVNKDPDAMTPTRDVPVNVYERSVPV